MPRVSLTALWAYKPYRATSLYRPIGLQAYRGYIQVAISNLAFTRSKWWRCTGPPHLRGGPPKRRGMGTYREPAMAIPLYRAAL